MSEQCICVRALLDFHHLNIVNPSTRSECATRPDEVAPGCARVLSPEQCQTR
jgi:hypothetical protein